MEEAERSALSTSLPELIGNIAVNTRFKAHLCASDVLDEDQLDTLFEKHHGKNFVFQLVQKLKRADGAGTFSTFQEVLRTTGQQEAVDVLTAEFEKHSHCSTGSMEAGSRGDPELMIEKGSPQLEVDGITAPSRPSVQRPQSLEISVKDELRSELKQRLPPRGTARTLGDIVVPKEYYGSVYNFASGKYDALPGPLPEIDCRVAAYSGFAYLPPDSCALISRAVGGRPSLTYHVSRGLSVLRTFDSEIAYCKANVYADPGSIIKCAIWVSLKCPFGESLRRFTVWSEFEARCLDTKEEIELCVPAEKWFSTTTSMGVKISRKRPTLEQSISEKREIVNQLLRKGNDDTSVGHVVVTSVYGRHVTAFSLGQSEREPGPLQTINSQSPAHNTHNVAFLPVECCATLIEFYGGEATLVRGKESGCDSLTSMTRHIVCLPALLCVQVSNESTSTIGSFFLAVDCQLSDAIAAAIGWFPSRAQSSGVDLDLQMTVRQWFKTSKTTGIVLFSE